MVRDEPKGETMSAMKESPAAEAHRSAGFPAPVSFFLIYVLVAVSFFIGIRGGWYMLLTPIVITFGLVPLFDAIVGVNDENPEETPRRGVALFLFLAAPF